MAGIYIHIPFCKQACNYCDFHFSTSLKRKDQLINALVTELAMRKSEFENRTVETIYFGGGTPSILENKELQQLLNAVYSNYKVIDSPEITLEANPDDLSKEKIKALSALSINRLSIGVQSFFEDDLQLMNRAHNANEALECIEFAKKYFNNISIDLIYGVPGSSNEQWRENIKRALAFGIPHISSYALTVEPKTALEHLIAKGKVAPINEDVSHEQFHILKEELEKAGFIHYELSNFGKPDFFSKNNSAYWQGKPYIGIGPSAHSFNGKERSWNIKNNIKYSQIIEQGKLPNEVEYLSVEDRYNEYVMTGLRTIWGVSLSKVSTDFGNTYLNHLEAESRSYIEQDLLYIEDNTLKTTLKGQFLCDGIASALFKIN